MGLERREGIEAEIADLPSPPPTGPASLLLGRGAGVGVAFIASSSQTLP